MTIKKTIPDVLNSNLIEGDDIYFNNKGLLVFTAKYHLKRGYCCGNGCLHCPYENENVPVPKRDDPLAEKPIKKIRN